MSSVRQVHTPQSAVPRLVFADRWRGVVHVALLKLHGYVRYEVENAGGATLGPCLPPVFALMLIRTGVADPREMWRSGRLLCAAGVLASAADA